MVEQSRYAIRTIGQLDFKQISPKADRAVFGFFVGIALIVYSLYHLVTALVAVPALWIILLVSIGWTCVAAWYAFFTKAHYQITVVLLDGSRFHVKRRHLKQAQGLLDGVTRAMDWHRSNDDTAIDANRHSHVRRRIATVGGIKSSQLAISSTTSNASGFTPDSVTSELVSDDKSGSHPLTRRIAMLSAYFRKQD